MNTTTITIELSDDDFKLLNHLCEEEACSWDEFVSIMIKSFIKLCPFHLDTLESYVDLLLK